MRFSPLLAAAFVALSVSAAVAQDRDWFDGMSFSVLGGQTVYPTLNYDGGRVNVDQGFNAGGRLGYLLDSWMPLSGFELQADVFYNQSDLSGQTRARFDSLSYMGNLVYHLDLGLPVGIYGGGGVGGVRTQIGDPLRSRDSTVFGWQALGGLDYALAPEATLFVEYRRQQAHNVNLGFPAGPVGNTTDNASVGVKFHM